MNKTALLSLLFCLVFAGCYLPRTTPLAATNCHTGATTARFNIVGRESSYDEISGFGGSVLYGVTDTLGVNLNILFEEARHEENGAVSRYSEFATMVDVVFEVIGGERMTPEGLREKESVSVSYYLGLGPVRQSWRGGFFEDEDLRYSNTVLAAHMGVQVEVPLARRLWSEFYLDLFTSEALGFFGIPFWTIGTNICFKLSETGQLPAAFAGFSVTNVQETVLTQNWIVAVGLIFDFGGPVALPPR